ncbi:uncharacterized protein MONOS_17556 [Monocercomonoides exilis]|uniref:uncharacterized protein n=1 Tax=Monocercomonoides exilis TaxID=2049356 RepID=UPI00355A87C2|nr:hypothetical protein MONOS_17556 [Monocercomonoides exilis]
MMRLHEEKGCGGEVFGETGNLLGRQHRNWKKHREGGMEEEEEECEMHKGERETYEYCMGMAGDCMQKKGLMRNSLVVQLAAMRESRPKTPKMEMPGRTDADGLSWGKENFLQQDVFGVGVAGRSAVPLLRHQCDRVCGGVVPGGVPGQLSGGGARGAGGDGEEVSGGICAAGPGAGAAGAVQRAVVRRGGELERIGEVQYRSGYKKHMDVGAALSRLKDPHTMYTMPCYNYYGYFSPYSFEIAYEEETGQPRAVYAVPGAMESLFEACLYRGLVEDIRDCAVVNISYDGAGYRAEEPWETIARWADENVMMSRSRAAREAGVGHDPGAVYVDGGWAVRETSWMMYGMSGADIYDITLPAEGECERDRHAGRRQQAGSSLVRLGCWESERRQQRAREITRQTLMGHAFGRLNFTRSQAQQGHRGRGATNAAANVRFPRKCFWSRKRGAQAFGHSSTAGLRQHRGRAQNHLNTTQFGEGGGSALVIKEPGGGRTGSNGKYRVKGERQEQEARGGALGKRWHWIGVEKRENAAGGGSEAEEEDVTVLPEDEKQFVAVCLRLCGGCGRKGRRRGRRGEKGRRGRKVRVVVDVRGNTGVSRAGAGLLHVLFPGSIRCMRQRFVKSMGNMLVAEELAGETGWVYALNREEATCLEVGGVGGVGRERLFDAEHVMVVSDGLCGGVCGQFVKHIAAAPGEGGGDRGETRQMQRGCGCGVVQRRGAVDGRCGRLQQRSMGRTRRGCCGEAAAGGADGVVGMEDTLSFGVGEEAESLELK